MAAPDDTDAQEAADLLAPDRVVKVGGQEVTVRAFRMRSAFRLWPLAQPIIQAMADAVDAAVEGERGSMSYGDFMAAVARYPDNFMAMVAESCGVAADWIEGLSLEDGDLLLATFWQVNRGFFMQRLVLLRSTKVRANTGQPPSPDNAQPLSGTESKTPPD